QGAFSGCGAPTAYIGMLASIKCTPSLNHAPRHRLALHLLPIAYREVKGSHAFDGFPSLFGLVVKVDGLDSSTNQCAYCLAPRSGNSLKTGDLVRREQDLNTSAWHGHRVHSTLICDSVRGIIAH